MLGNRSTNQGSENGSSDPGSKFAFGLSRSGKHTKFDGRWTLRSEGVVKTFGKTEDQRVTACHCDV